MTDEIARHSVVPTEIITVKLTHDLTASAGSILVIPVNDPAAIAALTPQQFAAFFQTPPATQVSPPLFENHKEVAKELLKYQLSPREMSFVNSMAVLEDTLTPRQQHWLEALHNRKNKKLLVIPRGRAKDRIIEGIAPQAARLLAAVAWAYNHTGAPVCLADLRKLGLITNKNDDKQFYSRLPELVMRGYAKRDKRDDKTPYYLMTDAGMNAVRVIGERPWLLDRLDVPKWFKD